MVTRKERIEQIEDKLYELALDGDSYWDEIDHFLDALPQNEETVEALVHFIKSGIDGCYEIYAALFSEKFIHILKERGEFDRIYKLARKNFDHDFEDVK